MAQHYTDYDPRSKSRARALRKDMTKEERKLWYEFLRELPIRFHRQYPIGPYIVDFCCHTCHLIIELDGGQHFEPTQAEYDAKRTEFLNCQGYTVLRYSNLEISQNFSGVCQDILQRVVRPCPSP